MPETAQRSSKMKIKNWVWIWQQDLLESVVRTAVSIGAKDFSGQIQERMGEEDVDYGQLF